MSQTFQFAIADTCPLERREGALDRVRNRFGLLTGCVEFMGHYPEYGYRLYQIVGEQPVLVAREPEPTVAEFQDIADLFLRRMLRKVDR